MGSDDFLPCVEDLPPLMEQAWELHFSTSSDSMPRSSGEWPKNPPNSGNSKMGIRGVA